MMVLIYLVVSLEEKVEHLDHREWKKKQKIKELEKELQNKTNSNMIGAPIDDIYKKISMRGKVITDNMVLPLITVEDQSEIKQGIADLKDFLEVLKHIFESLVEFFKFRLQKSTEIQKDDTVISTLSKCL